MTLMFIALDRQYIIKFDEIERLIYLLFIQVFRNWATHESRQETDSHLGVIYLSIDLALFGHICHDAFLWLWEICSRRFSDELQFRLPVGRLAKSHLYHHLLRGRLAASFNCNHLLLHRHSLGRCPREAKHYRRKVDER